MTTQTGTAKDAITMRFGTLCGAEVVVVPRRETARYGWKCLGCDDGPVALPLTLTTARREANDHAGICRSKPTPQPDPPEGR